ncbi:hypothetical protein [Chitinimonas sp. BJB300]
MKIEHYASKNGGELELDICFDCQLIWFDQYESAQLTAAAVVGLFDRLHAQHEKASRHVTLSIKLGCLRCNDTLLSTQDVARGNHFSYYRCASGHGRLITFWHFLKEKQFVRDLTEVERKQLAVKVAQIRCNSCGAQVDVRNHSACNYCRAPFAVLDREAVAKALSEYRQGVAADRPIQVGDEIIARERISEANKRSEANDELQNNVFWGMAAIDLLFRLLR